MGGATRKFTRARMEGSRRRRGTEEERAAPPNDCRPRHTRRILSSGVSSTRGAGWAAALPE